MVKTSVIVEGFSVAPNLTENDFPALAAAGYKTIINNRHDGEEPNQLTAAQAQKLAEENGLSYLHIPIAIQAITPTDVEQFSNALKTNPRPILAHCKTGTRSCLLWAMTTAKDKTLTIDELMQCAAKGGYDLSNMRSLVEQSAVT